MERSDHIDYIESKVAKRLGLLKVKRALISRPGISFKKISTRGYAIAQLGPCHIYLKVPK